MTEHNDDDASLKPNLDVIRLNVPQRILIIPSCAFILGSALGIMRGGRAASLRFLAENAHRPPTTVQGWYFYKKTKNYKVMWGALKGAGKEATKLTLLAGVYVGIEEGLGRAGGVWSDVREVGAAVGCAGVFAGVYRLPISMARRTIGLGLIIGGAMQGLEWARNRRDRPAGEVTLD